jgi:hypothetical protein
MRLKLAARMSCILDIRVLWQVTDEQRGALAHAEPDRLLFGLRHIEQVTEKGNAKGDVILSKICDQLHQAFHMWVALEDD